ncbi:Calcineurin-like phosphoesterase domain [Trypanosoma melophagium]|uniref:Calcineurin-like phosphoesterase domain n=1 Tax=Trypanosoma melophagium TaxID=715481 RepID=UPI003519F388|nr:Calcineurin-like phosphoesterase domain [Trypanosoma melophagium]
MASLVHHFFKVKGGTTETTPIPPTPPSRAAHVAVVGCCHGELDAVYEACAAHEAATGRRIDFLLCCGDFQAVRGAADLQGIAVPRAHRRLGDFAAYYRREQQAPYLTLLIGGNHEVSDWLAEEAYGGFLAPNIYYIGHAGAVIVDGGITVAGISGIYKAYDYTRPYPPMPYYASETALRSAFHVRRIEVEKLKAFLHALESVQVHQKQEKKEQHQEEATTSSVGNSSGSVPSYSAAAFPRVDLFLSHDWPVGITKYGDEAQLLRYKPFFEDDIRHAALGNPYTMPLLRAARPRYWFAAHLHCQFEATVPFKEVDGVDVAAGVPQSTKFMALDKCSKGKGFLDFFDIPVYDKNPKVEEKVDRKSEGMERVVHHPLWLEVLRETHGLVAANDNTWSAESCALRQYTPQQLEHLGLWLPANNTASVLKALGLSTSPLQPQQQQRQQPIVEKEKKWEPRLPPNSKHVGGAQTLVNGRDTKLKTPSCSSVAAADASDNDSNGLVRIRRDAPDECDWTEDTAGAS